MGQGVNGEAQKARATHTTYTATQSNTQEDTDEPRDRYTHTVHVIREHSSVYIKIMTSKNKAQGQRAKGLLVTPCIEEWGH